MRTVLCAAFEFAKLTPDSHFPAAIARRASQGRTLSRFVIFSPCQLGHIIDSPHRGIFWSRAVERTGMAPQAHPQMVVSLLHQSTKPKAITTTTVRNDHTVRDRGLSYNFSHLQANMVITALLFSATAARLLFITILMFPLMDMGL